VLAAAATSSSRLTGQGRRILLVEDNEAAIIQMCDILNEQGYQVVVARDGREALAQIALAPPDALILDLMMPGVDGFAVLQSVRSAPATAALPVLILTAKHVTREELAFLHGNNIQELIQKGDISRAELLAAVAKLASAQASRPAEDARTAYAPPQDGKPLILVVEDNPDNRRAVSAILGDQYRVIEAADGQAGVAQAQAHHPALILMDIAMPVLDGIQALAAIRDDDTLRRTPVIALTASAMVGDREAILAHGFDGYLTKPIEAELLLQAIRGTLKRDL